LPDGCSLPTLPLAGEGGGKKKEKLGMMSNGGDVTAHTYKEGEDEEEGITAGRRREEDIQ
jgi:hypothetical protein